MWRAPKFWYETDGGLLPALLAPAGALYGGVVALRARATVAAKAPVPVVCIGNPGLGGGGKTPTAIAVAARLARLGATPHFLTRGYGGRLAGPVTVEAGRHIAGDVGDEPLLLTRHAPTHVARDRVAGARHAAGAGARVIVMDDGYQNPSLAKDLALLVVDGKAGIGNGRVFPAGPLRERLDAQLVRADALIIVGDGDAGECLARTCRDRGIAVLGARFEPAAAAPDLRGLDVIAVSGIAAPRKFEASLAASGARVVESLRFADHHPYSRGDVGRILAAAGRRPDAVPVTTEKDRVRIGDDIDPEGSLRARLQVLPVELVFDEPGRIDLLLGDLVSGRGQAGT